jgi:hypothetical protein
MRVKEELKTHAVLTAHNSGGNEHRAPGKTSGWPRPGARPSRLPPHGEDHGLPCLRLPRRPRQRRPKTARSVSRYSNLTGALDPGIAQPPSLHIRTKVGVVDDPYTRGARLLTPSTATWTCWRTNSAAAASAMPGPA